MRVSKQRRRSSAPPSLNHWPSPSVPSHRQAPLRAPSLSAPTTRTVAFRRRASRASPVVSRDPRRGRTRPLVLSLSGHFVGEPFSRSVVEEARLRLRRVRRRFRFFWWRRRCRRCRRLAPLEAPRFRRQRVAPLERPSSCALQRRSGWRCAARLRRPVAWASAAAPRAASTQHLLHEHRC